MLREIWDEKCQHVACNIATCVRIIKVWSKRYDIDIMSETFESLWLGSPAIQYVRWSLIEASKTADCLSSLRWMVNCLGRRNSYKGKVHSRPLNLKLYVNTMHLTYRRHSQTILSFYELISPRAFTGMDIQVWWTSGWLQLLRGPSCAEIGVAHACWDWCRTCVYQRMQAKPLHQGTTKVKHMRLQ